MIGFCKRAGQTLVVVVAAGLLWVSGGVAASPFTPGNLVVYRIGPSGTVTTLAATGNAVFLDEYTTTGTLVQTIAMPTVTSGTQLALAASGTAVVDGLLTRSTNGNCLAVPGYGRDLGTGTGNLTTTGTTASGGAISRVVARVSTTGAVDTSTALTDFALGSNFRSATSSDCSAFWVSGSASAANTSAGVHYATFGSTTSADLTTVGGFTAGRQVAIYGGQLYASSASTTANRRGIFAVGTGIPNTANTPVRVTGLTDTNSASSYGFVFADLNSGVAGVDTLYVADDTAATGTGSTTTGGGIHKFSLIAGTWTWNGTVGVAADAYRGLTAVVNGASVTLYATRKSGSVATPGGELVTLTDNSGYNGSFSGIPTLLATAATGNVFRGVALAPEVTVTSSAGTNGTVSPLGTQIAGGGSTRAFTVTPDSGYTAVVGGTCGGTLVGTTFTTSPLTVNCTVSATFTAVPTYTVTPSVTGSGGISPSTGVTVLSGSTTVFTVTASPGFSSSVGGTCGGTLVGTTYTTNAITGNCTVDATFTQITYTMTPSAGANGAISPSTPQTVNALSTQVFTVTPNAGYSASVGGTCGGSLVGTAYTTNAASANCTVDATFTALPTFTVTPVVTGSGAVSPATAQSVLQNATVVFTPTPAPGYSVVMSGCGGKMSGSTFTTAPVTANCTVTASFSQKNILFVGNSYTFARVDPAMTFNAANVNDLTTGFNAAFPNGTNSWPWSGATCTGVPFADGCFEPHPWGGVPGIFKALTVQAGLDYNVSLSTRNAATLRGHFLNTSNAVWDLRGNIASQKWDIVMVQGQSDEPLPANKSKNGNPASFKTYANQIAKYVHQGNGLAVALVTTEQAIYAAEGFGTSSNTTPRTIPPNFNANPSAKVFVMQNWSRPDMVEAHKCTVADYTSIDGAPLVDPTCAANTNGTGGSNNVFYTAQPTTALNLNDITTDMNSSLSSLVTGNSQFSGVIPTGNAFQKAVDAGVVKNSNFYNAGGTYDESGLMNLWWVDRTHGSKHGSYVSALVHFARLTGQDPTQFGGGDAVASGLFILPVDAVTLQQMAKAAVVPGAPTAASASAGNGQVTVSFNVPVNLGGLDITGYTATCGSQSVSGIASPIVVSGLTNGASVSCTVVATNSVGNSVPSAASSSVTPVTVPGAPVIGMAVAGDTTVSVAFAVPPSDGGSTILSYAATCGTQSNPGAASPITVAGLANGVAVTCTVIATNAVGPGAPSAASNSVTPQASQTISFPVVATQTFVPSGTFAVAATASSLLTVSFASVTPIICSVSGSTVSMLSTGACTIRASQAGNPAFAAAPDIDQTITIQAPAIALSPLTIPTGTVGLTYATQALAASGGTGPYTFALTAGTLPVGLTLTAAGSLSGTPSTAATSNFTVTVTDSSGVSVGGPFTGTRAYSIVVSKGLPVTVVTANLNPAVVGQMVVFTAMVTAVGPAVTGTVNFLDGTSAICSGVALAGTQAQCVTDMLPAGARSITAIYSGDSRYLDSTSVVLTQTVNASGTIVLTVARAGSGAGTVQGSPPGINCGTDCTETYASPTPVSLTATPNVGSIFTGWSGACVGRASCDLTLASSASVVATFAPAATPLNLDIDGSRAYLGQSDGLIIVRYLFGVRGAAITADTLAVGADPALITQHLDDIRPLLDIDGDGRADALTDGVLMMRYLLGLRGNALINSAVSPAARRTTFGDIQGYLLGITPVLP